MDVLLLCAGLGTRLRPLTNSIPKCLAPINGYPILYYWLDELNSCNSVSRVFINTHYLNESVDDFMKAVSGLKKEIIILHEPEILGTGQTAKRILDEFQVENLLVIHADNYSSVNIENLYQNLIASKNSTIESIICSFFTNDPSSCGMLEVNSQNIMVNYNEKPVKYEGSKANAAIFITSKKTLLDFFKVFPHSNDLCKDFLPHLIFKALVMPIEGYHIDIGKMENLISAKQYKKKIKSLILDSYWLENYLHKISKFDEISC